MMFLPFAIHLFLGTTAWAIPFPDIAPSPTSSALSPPPTICGDLVNSGGKVGNVLLSNERFWLINELEIEVRAKDAYDCMISVPFNPAVATRFLHYYNNTIQFHSTLAYLKDPPASYQQPAVDLLAGLDQIRQQIEEGVFQNQYAFEAHLQNLIYSAHDTHLRLVSGVLAAFSFAAPFGIVSVSEDGIQLPKVYVTGNHCVRCC